jgi:hypothetical protein
MIAFDLSAYPPALATLLEQLPLAPLGPGKPDQAVRDKLAALDGGSDFGRVAADRNMVEACRAGMYLAFDFLDESHTISQEIHTAEGSYWHALMHRREPDASNSKYWWRQVGRHPVFAQLTDEAARLGWKAWDANAFVDECEKERGSGSEREMLLREVQRAEWKALFDWCYGHAKG